VNVMRRRREPQLEDALIEHPLGALAALAVCVLIASCFFSIFVSKLWAIALGLPVGIVCLLISAASIATFEAHAFRGAVTAELYPGWLKLEAPQLQ
jgi:hypothetical protein